MKKILKVFVVIFGIFILLVILAWPMAPVWAKLGAKPICISGSFPHIKIVDCPDKNSSSPQVTPVTLTSIKAESPVPIIVDDDGSPDGTIALLYFLSNPLFEVKAVTISNGEAHPAIFAEHIAWMLAGFGKGDIPIGAGRGNPLEGNNAFPDEWRQVSDNFWGMQPPQAADPKQPSPAAQLIVDVVTRSDQPVRIFVSGTHTNLAEALRLDPSLKAKIKDIYIMGGSVYKPGNIKSDYPAIDNEVAEWNIWVDPVAAQEVFASGLDLHLTPLDATQQVIWQQADADRWAKATSPEGKLADNLLQWMLDSWSKKGVFIWDLVAAVNATDAAFCPPISLALDVVTQPGKEKGRTVVTNGTANTTVCLEPEAGQIKAYVESIFTK